ncbi:hypothetical protein [Streptomyces sp. S1D4-20]|uniref:hypothetical protein n=1 Tax=Streptomyces sp. S1D4-20 TaxID=2594462 RepID=UPI00116494AF|nr:hypothetical protein [Streptomyces sp. S1D4-20]QDN54222.1 hypothetical protein FNV67_01240 [Streptomyces sp. S1D4-20]
MNTTDPARSGRDELRALGAATGGSILDGIPVVSAVLGGAAAFRVIQDRSGRYPLALAVGLGAAITTYGVVENLVDARRSELYRASHTSPDRTAALPTTDAQMLSRLQSAAVHAARRDAATHATSLDSGKKLLTNEQLWQGHPDGTATAELPGGTTLTYRPVPVSEHNYVHHTYLLTRPGTGEPVEMHTMAGLVRLIEQANTGPADADTTTEAVAPGALGKTGEEFGVDSPPAEAEVPADTVGAQEASAPAGEPTDEPLPAPQTTA